MSKFAIPVSSSDHQEIRAEKALETYGVNASYICAMPGCSAKMILCDPSSNRTAYFRSIHKADHIYDYCTDSSLSFNPDEYDESNFHTIHIFHLYIFAPKRVHFLIIHSKISLLSENLFSYGSLEFAW